MFRNQKCINNGFIFVFCFGVFITVICFTERRRQRQRRFLPRKLQNHSPLHKDFIIYLIFGGNYLAANSLSLSLSLCFFHFIDFMRLH